MRTDAENSAAGRELPANRQWAVPGSNGRPPAC